MWSDDALERESVLLDVEDVKLVFLKLKLSWLDDKMTSAVFDRCINRVMSLSASAVTPGRHVCSRVEWIQSINWRLELNTVTGLFFVKEFKWYDPLMRHHQECLSCVSDTFRNKMHFSVSPTRLHVLVFQNDSISLLESNCFSLVCASEAAALPFTET